MESNQSKDLGPIPEPRPQLRPESFYKTNLFWGCVSAILAVILPSLANIMDNVLWAQLMFPLAWMCGLIACWCVFKGISPPARGVILILCAAFIFIGLYKLYGRVREKAAGTSLGRVIPSNPMPLPQEPAPRKAVPTKAKAKPNRKPEEKEGAQEGVSTPGVPLQQPYGTQTVEPGGTGYQANGPGAHAGPVIIDGDTRLIHTVELRVDMDVPTDKASLTTEGRSVGIQTAVALFDRDNTRYMFTNSDAQFVTWQRTENIHRFGFVYKPQDASQLVGQAIGFLSRMDTFVVNYSEFIKIVLRGVTMQVNESGSVRTRLILNELQVAEWTMKLPTEELTSGESAAKINDQLISVESIYVSEMAKRQH